jgi:hypothetical protein
MEKRSSLLGPFVTSEYFPKARVLDYIRPEKLAREKHSCLLGPFLTYKYFQQATMFNYTRH